MTDAGGFDPNDRISTGLETEEHKPVRTDDALAPLTIRQIINAYETSDSDPPIIDGVPRKYVSLVGMITEVSEDNISIIYEIDDGTGRFRVQDYTQNGQDNLSASYEENTYIYVVGKVKKDKDNPAPFITAFSVKPVTDPNQIAYHNLQALYVHLFTTRGLPHNSAYEKTFNQNTYRNTGQNFETSGAANSTGNNDTSMPTIDLAKQAVMNFIKLKDQTYGVHIDEIRKNLSSKFSGEDVDRAVEALAYTGEIYTTAEQDHYAIC